MGRRSKKTAGRVWFVRFGYREGWYIISRVKRPTQAYVQVYGSELANRVCELLNSG